MSLKNLIKMIGTANIAKDLDKEELTEIAVGVVRRFNEDVESMKEWADCVDEGLKLCKPEFRPLSSPWDGAANFKSTLLTEASNQFGNRATIELMRDDKLVKASIVGIKTLNNAIERNFSSIAEINTALEQASAEMQQMQEAGVDVSDMDAMIKQLSEEVNTKEKKIKENKFKVKQKLERADRVTEVMNWQVNTRMKEWRGDHKRLLYSLPNIGCIFKKTYYDETVCRCVSDVINYPDFAVNQATTSLTDARSFTHILAISQNKAKERMAAGIWVDTIITKSDDFDGDKNSNESEKVTNARDNNNGYLEQYCWLDLDDDGYEEPYIATVHESSLEVMRIVARYTYNDIHVRYEDRVYKLDDAIKARAKKIQSDNENFGTKEELPEAMDLTGFSVVRIEASPIISKYGFIPSYDGSFLDVGFFHLIGSITVAVNKTTNDLLNNGTLSNTNGGWTAKGFRKKQGPMKIKPGEFHATEVPYTELQQSIMPYPFKEPSQTLYALNEKLENIGRSFSTNADLGGQLQANTAPTTALAMVQESLINQTAHISNISSSLTDEFRILFTLNRDHLDPDEYKIIVGDDEAVFSEDFNTDGLSIDSTANPELASRTQRMMLAEAEMAQVPLVIQAGGNPIPIIKNYFSRIGSDNIDEIFPNIAEMSAEDKQQVSAMKEQQELSNQLQQQQLQMLTTQAELLKRGEDRKDAEFTLKKQEVLSKLNNDAEMLEKIKADVLLTVQQALTEHTKNNLSITSAISAEMDKTYQLASETNALDVFAVGKGAENEQV